MTSRSASCVLVLGMHRSGTSSLTRALSALGLQLGEPLLAPASENNETGFWELAELVAINEEILDALEIPWDSYESLPEDWIHRLPEEHTDRAIALVKRNFDGVPAFALKDPRVCRLWPFWIRVLKKTDVKVIAIHIVRAPAEVAASLARRDDHSVERGAGIWIRYVLEAESIPVPRLLLNYDTLLSDSQNTVQYMRNWLARYGIPASATGNDFIKSLLQPGLRHHYQLPSIPGELGRLAQEIYVKLAGMSSRGGEAETRFASTYETLTEERFESLIPSVTARYEGAQVARLLKKIGIAARERALTGRHVRNLNAIINNEQAKYEELQNRIADDKRLISGLLVEQKEAIARIETLSRQRAGDAATIAKMRLNKEEAKARIAELIENEEKATAQIAALIKHEEKARARIAALVESEEKATAQIAGLIENEEKAAAQIAGLIKRADELSLVKALDEQRMRDLETIIAAGKVEVESLRASRSWRLTFPLRAFAAVGRITLNWLGLRVPGIALIPGNDLRAAGQNVYEVTGNDPWFRMEILRRERLGRWRKGWYTLKLRGVESSESLTPKLYVDYGEGMSERSAISLPVELASGARAFIFLRKRATELRLDPAERPLHFRLEGVDLRHVPTVLAVATLAWPLASQAIRHPRLLRDRLLNLMRIWHSGGIDAVMQRMQQLRTDRRNYDYWVECYDTIDEKRLDHFRRANEQLALRPRISILVPIYNAPEAWLRRCIESVLEQTYPDWELCLADDASTASHVARVIAEFAGRDSRIKSMRREKNGHISAASNSALALATGEFVALLDHDDELAPCALYWIAATIAEHPDNVLIYTDEDKVDEKGERFEPYFKPDWNPELLCAQNYVSHLGVYRREAVLAVGGFREGFEGSQDWDLVLRISSRCRANQIHHVPRILYHWRSTKGSTALHAEAKSYASDAGLRAVSESLVSAGVRASVERIPEGYNRIRYELPDSSPLVSIIIPTRNGRALVEMCVESLLRKTQYSPYEIILVDNQSDDVEALACFHALSQRRDVRVVRYDAPFNFSAINNFGVAQARGSVLVLLNNDIEIIHGDWLTELVRHAVRPQNGVVGAKLLYPDRTIQHAGIIVGFGGVAGHIGIREPNRHQGQMSRCRVAQNLTAVTGACMAVRKSVYMEVGGMDADSLRVAFNDVDLCLKIAARGYRNVWTPYAELIHHESASRGSEDTPEKQARFAREVQFMKQKWGDVLQDDPAYNPNLDLDRRPFELSYPPRVALAPK